MQAISILKFGGTSMGDEHTWRKVMDIIRRYDRPVVVVSATAKTTRQLVKAAELAPENRDQALEIADKIGRRHKKLIENLLVHADSKLKQQTGQQCRDWIDKQVQSLKDYIEVIHDEKLLSKSMKDAVSSVGERLSSYLFATCAPLFGLNTVWADATGIITTDSRFGNANPLYEKIEQNAGELAQASAGGKLPVIGGYYGQDLEGNITTLGFEGSDFTASLLGAALEAGSIEIWTDVSGIFTCDPRVVKDAEPIQELSFAEATELAYFGAKVLHPSTMKPAAQKQISLKVKNIFEPDHPGTVIHAAAKANGWAKALTFIEEATVITVQASGSAKGHPFLAEIFGILDSYHLPVDVVTTTEASVSLAIETARLGNGLIERLQRVGDINREPAQAIISLIGCSLSTSRDFTEIVFGAIPEAKCTMISFSQSKKNLNLVVPNKDLLPAVKSLHKKVFG